MNTVSVASSAGLMEVEDAVSGLKANARALLLQAKGRGVTTPQEIALLLPQEARRDKELFAASIIRLGTFFKQHGVRILADKEAVAHRVQYPKPAKKEPAQLRIIERGEDAGASKYRTLKPEEVSAQEVERVGSSYEHDLLAQYWSEAGRRTLLSSEEEFRLAKRVRDENDLGARNTLVEHNLRLVRWVARRYSWSKMELADLIQAGNEGLITAATRFDYTEGNKFSTYAVWWIRQSIGRVIMNEGDLIRLPVHMHETRFKLQKISEDLAAKLGRIPSLEEIATDAEIPKEKIRRTLLKMKISVTSLDEPTRTAESSGRMNEGDELTLGESIPDDGAMGADLLIEARQELERAQEDVAETLKTVADGLGLSARDKEIFVAYYGLDGHGKKRTLEEVGAKFHITRERVRQIVAQIWSKAGSQGLEMDQEQLFEELARIDELQKLVAAGSRN